MKNKIKILLIVLLLIPGFVSCNLDVDNPNSPSPDDLHNYDGIRMTAIGMQSRLSQAIGDFNTVSGAVSGETSPTIAYLSYQSLRRYPDNSKRSRLDNTNEYCVTLWRAQFQIIKSAQDILNNIQTISLNDTLKKNIIAFAEMGKVMAFFNLITTFEKIPVDINPQFPVFTDRNGVITEALKLIADAESNTSMGLYSTFKNNIIGKTWDLVSTIKAYKARFLLMQGDYAGAAAAANSVTTESQFIYTVQGTNPLYENFTRSLFSRALASWIRGAEKGDIRVTAMTDTSTIKTGYFGSDTAAVIIKYNNSTLPYKFYTLNEMTLIKAEAYARAGGGDPVAEVNKIRAAAGLPLYSGSNILKEIFVQRYYELYAMALHWEDLRRFKNDNIDIVNYQRATQLAHEFLVYPYSETDTNPNTPPQPVNINYGL